MTALSTVASRPQQFTIGRVLGASLGIFLRNGLPFSIVGVVFAAPYLAVSFFFFDLDSGFSFVGSLQQGQIGVFLARALTNISLPIAASMVMSAALAHATHRQLRGTRAATWQSFAHGLARPLDVLSTVLIFTLLCSLGYILYEVPAFIVGAVFWPCMPVIVLEKKSAIVGLRRSRDLTKGRRWPLFGLQLLLALGFVLIYWAEARLFRTILSFRTLQYINIGTWVISTTFGAVMDTVVYYYLRADREGVAMGDIGEVFG